jgi:hypothetical protein
MSLPSPSVASSSVHSRIAPVMSTAAIAPYCCPFFGFRHDAIVGVDVFGDVYLWTDRNGSDGSGADIVSRGLIKDGWRPLAYSN